MNIRLLMIALLAIVCNTSKADDPVDGSPLNPWWDSNANGYVLRTIDDEHTVLDAMKALQEINGNDWSSYSSYYFYLAEDVDLSKLKWQPLGTSSYPFCGYFSCYKPTYDYCDIENNSFLSVYPNINDKPDATKEIEGVTYTLIPTNLGSLGYYNDDSGNSTYYSTDGHIGTCKIMNMTVEGEYDGAGFFGVVSPYCEFHGFTFENCSVTNEKEDGYAGILYGYCGDTSDAPDIYDIFIGQSESRLCYVKADYAGGIYGSSDCENPPYIYSAGNMSSYTFDPELSPYIPDRHEGAYYADDYDGSDGTPGNSVNKIYVSITASKYGNKISCNVLEAQNTYVYAEGISDESAFGGGTGTYSDPFIISEKQHLLNLQDILNNGEISYMSFTDLSGLDLSYDNNSSYTVFDGLYFKQTADITFTDELTAGIGIDDYLDSNTPGGPFAGYYDGGGHTIYVNISTESDHAALFANTYNATIQNLRIVGTNSSSSGYAAGIVGNQLSSSTLTLNNCIIDVKIEGSDYKCYGLIGYLDTSNYNLNLSDCFNKGANDLEIFAGADSYFADNSPYLYSWTTACGVGTPSYPLQISSLRDLNPNSYEEEKKDMAREFIEECGLTYELTNNVILQNNKLVDPDGEYIGPNDASNENYYIEKFCGTLIGGYYDNDNETAYTNIISGLTDKALFGTITGNSKIEKIGFVNCYNASNQKVKLANYIADGATVSVQECYTDGYFDFVMGKDVVNDNTIIDSYSYSDIDQKVIPIKNFKKMGGSATWENDAINPNRQVITSNCIRPSQSSTTYYYHSDYSFQTVDVGITTEPTIFAHNDYTDAISTIPVNNCIWRTTDPRMQFKYNVINTSDEQQVVRYMYLTDVTALSNTSSAMTDYEINSLGFDFSCISPSYNGVNIYYNLPYTVDNIYYRRIKHNDWESVSLPFAYSLSDIKNSSNFKAYTYSTYSKTDGESEAKFTSLTDSDSDIQLGQPVLFFNTDKTKYDFIVKKSNPDMTGDIYPKNSVKEPFYGVLHTAGYKGTFIHMEESIIEIKEKENEYDDDKMIEHLLANIFKISGSGTATTGTLLRCAETSWIYPFRAYLKLDIPFATPTENNAKSIRFSIFDNNTTSIDTAELATKIITTDNIYSLDGRKVSAKGINGLKAGLYIMNGKKFVVK